MKLDEVKELKKQKRPDAKQAAPATVRTAKIVESAVFRESLAKFQGPSVLNRLQEFLVAKSQRPPASIVGGGLMDHKLSDALNGYRDAHLDTNAVLIYTDASDVVTLLKVVNHDEMLGPRSRALAKQLRRLGEDVELFEMPMNINAVEFQMDVPNVNRRVAMDFRQHGEVLEEISDDSALYQLKNRIALVRYTAGKPTAIIYYVQWKEIFHKMIGHKAISQVAVWADSVDPRSSGIARRIFWEFLLPICGVMITDALQSPDGKRFWRNRVADAFKQDLHVYYINLMQSKGGAPGELTEIGSVDAFAELAADKNFWGDQELHQARKIIISEIEL